jgi:hypothetical protein
MPEDKTRDNLWNSLLHWLYSDNFIIFGVKLGDKCWKTIVAAKDSKKVFLKSKQCKTYEDSLNSIKREVDEFIEIENAIGGEDD